MRHASRFLGRKSALVRALRASATRERMLLNGIVRGSRRPVAAARKPSSRASRTSSPPMRASTSRSRGRGQRGAPAPAHADPPRDRGIFLAWATRCGTGTSRDRMGELRRADERPRPSIALAVPTPSNRREHGAAHAHIAGPDSRDGSSARADLPVAPGRLQARYTGRDALADLPAGRVPRRDAGSTGRPPGTCSSLPRALREEREVACGRASSVHRAVVEFDVTCSSAAARVAPRASTRLDRDGAAQLGRPRRLPQRRHRSGEFQGFASASASSASRCSGRPGPTASFWRSTFEYSDSFSEVPVSWLASTSTRLPVEELARTLVFTSCEFDRIVGAARPAERTSSTSSSARCSSGQASNADKLQLTRVDVSERRAALDRLRCVELRWPAATVGVVAAGRRMRAASHDREAQAAWEVSEG